MKNILISTECVADIPGELVEKYNIGIIYYTIKTDMGEFRDTDEITAMNVMEYMMGGEKKALGIIPTARGYENFFRDSLKEYDEIVHISISSGVSGACNNAKTAREALEGEKDRVHIVDSQHLSSGLGLVVLEAARLNMEGRTISEIVAHAESVKQRVSTSFLTYSADYLYYNGKVSENVMKICRKFSLHPILAMVDGKLSLKGVYIGRYEHAADKYLKKVMKQRNKIRKYAGFITYAGCSHKALEKIADEVQKKIGFEKLYEQQASASISCNCGPNTFGVLFIKKDV